MIIFRVKNWHPKIRGSERVFTVQLSIEMQMSVAEWQVIEWLKQRQPYLIDGEKWEVVQVIDSNGTMSFGGGTAQTYR